MISSIMSVAARRDRVLDRRVRRGMLHESAHRDDHRFREHPLLLKLSDACLDGRAQLRECGVVLPKCSRERQLDAGGGTRSERKGRFTDGSEARQAGKPRNC